MLQNKACFGIVFILGICSFGFASDEGIKAGAEYPALSPNGSKVVFTNNISGDRDIWIADGNGANAMALLLWAVSDEKQPTWSPDGAHVVFSSNRDSAKHQIWRVNADGSNAVQLTFDNVEHEQPRYSPDGASILFISNGTGKKELWIMKADGSGSHPLALISMRISDPAWSPSGAQIVYVGCTRGAACNLFQINSNGSGGAQITNGNFQDWTPAWGPSGIVFASNRNGSQGLWLIRPDGTGLQQITNPDGAGDLDPNFQIGGGGFVFTRSGVTASDAAADVWFAAAAGVPPQQLTKLVADKTPPVITPTVTGTVGQNGWYISSVTINWDVADPESGIASSNGCDLATLSQDTPGVSITCTAVNGVGLSASATITIKIDQTPPTIVGMPPAGCTLWPPNHKLVQVASVSTNDSGSGVSAFNVMATSSEVSLTGTPDTVITGADLQPRSVQLRAERNGSGSGRTYIITATATDSAGNTTTMIRSCSVPHDQGL